MKVAIKWLTDNTLKKIGGCPIHGEPRQWDVLSGKKLIVGFSDKYDINIIDIDSGDKKIISRVYSPAKIVKEDKDEYLANHLNDKDGRTNRGANKFVIENIEFPDFKPAFKKIIVDNENNILVFPYSKEDQGKSGFKASSFDAFDENGNFINHVKIVDSKVLNLQKIIPVSDNEFWCFETENDVDIVLVKYRLK